MLPEILEAGWAELHVADRMLDIPLAKVKLDCARIVAGIRRIKAGRMAIICG
jgi:hypothetical protein